MRVIETKIYKYDELSDSAKQSARDWYASDLGYDWWDCTYDDFARICEILGVELDTKVVTLMNGDTRRDPKIYFEGFSHQGSGSAFEGNYYYKKGAHKAIRQYAPIDEELHRIADTFLSLQKRHFYSLTASISQGRYYSLSVDAQKTDFINGGSDYVDADVDAELSDILQDLNGWLYSALESQYEYLVSDEAVEESIIANEYEFTVDGTIH